MAVVLDDLGVYLAAQGEGTVGTNIFLGSMPDSPDDLVALIEVGGDPPVDTFGAVAGNINVEKPQIQVQCRAAQDDYSSARVKAESVYKNLHGLAGATLNGTKYLSIDAVESPFNIGRDQNGRWLSGFNIILWKLPNA